MPWKPLNASLYSTTATQARERDLERAVMQQRDAEQRQREQHEFERHTEDCQPRRRALTRSLVLPGHVEALEFAAGRRRRVRSRSTKSKRSTSVQ